MPSDGGMDVGYSSLCFLFQEYVQNVFDLRDEILNYRIFKNEHGDFGDRVGKEGREVCSESTASL